MSTDQQQGRVLFIHSVAVKRGPATALSKADVLEDFGIVGDYRSRRGKGRQITLIEEEALTDVARVIGLPAGNRCRQ